LPTDDDINAFLDQYSLRYSHWVEDMHDCDDLAREYWCHAKTWLYSLRYSHWVEDMHDCDDLAREYWCHAKTWFWTQRQQNVAFGFLLRASTPTQKAHALNFYVLPNMFLRFLNRGERVPLGGRAYLVLI
jgi:hypothetical protein